MCEYFEISLSSSSKEEKGSNIYNTLFQLCCFIKFIFIPPFADDVRNELHEKHFGFKRNM